MSKHTPGPLSVSIEDNWPFRIVTKNKDGEIVFAKEMPCHSTKQHTAAEVMAGLGMPQQWNTAGLNAQALADEVLRAAAPELLAALLDVQSAIYIDDAGQLRLARSFDNSALNAAIAKAAWSQS